MVTEFFEHLQNVTTNIYDSLTELHSEDHCNYSTHKVSSSLAVAW
jgi:hypothetical protein